MKEELQEIEKIYQDCNEIDKITEDIKKIMENLDGRD